MKKLMLLSMVAFQITIARAGWAEDTSPTFDGAFYSIQGYRFGACEYWQSIASSLGGSGYACSFYPRNIVVPDGYDVDRALSAAAGKIADLERRIAVLESKIPRK